MRASECKRKNDVMKCACVEVVAGDLNILLGRFESECYL